MNNHFLKNAFALRRRGWLSCIPIVHGGKTPCINKWETRAANPADDHQIARWASQYPNAGVGFVYGGNEHVLGIDLDFLDEEKANRAFARTKSIFGPPSLLRIGRYPKRLLLYLYNGVSLPGKAFGGFEIFHSSGQTIFYGIHPETLRPYEWVIGDPREIGPSDLLEVSNEQILELIAALRPLQGPKKHAGERKALREANPTFDSQAASDRLSGAAADVLPELRTTEDPLLAAIEILASAKKGSRYTIAFGLVIALVKFGYSDAEIWQAMSPVYASLFQDVSERRQHLKAIESALVWARKEIGPDLQTLLAQPAIQSLHTSWAMDS